MLHAAPQLGALSTGLNVPSQPQSSYSRRPPYASNSHPGAGGLGAHAKGAADLRSAVSGYRHNNGIAQVPSPGLAQVCRPATLVSSAHSDLTPAHVPQPLSASSKHGQQGNGKKQDTPRQKNEKKRKTEFKNTLRWFAAGTTFVAWNLMRNILAKIAKTDDPGAKIPALLEKSKARTQAERDQKRRAKESEITKTLADVLLKAKRGDSSPLLSDEDRVEQGQGQHGPYSRNRVWEAARKRWEELQLPKPPPEYIAPEAGASLGERANTAASS